MERKQPSRREDMKKSQDPCNTDHREKTIQWEKTNAKSQNLRDFPEIKKDSNLQI
jgi:hypothetical protein